MKATSFASFVSSVNICFILLLIPEITAADLTGLTSLENVASLTSLRNARNSSSKYHVLYPNSTVNDDYDFQHANGPCLNNYNCFYPYGICLNDTMCLCMPEYANIYIKELSLHEMSCSYKKKKMVVAGLLELFLPFGLGHFYAGHLTLATIKFFYNILVYAFCCLLYSKGHDHDQMTKVIMFCVIMSCVLPLWNVLDLFLFFTGSYRDGYGVPLA